MEFITYALLFASLYFEVFLLVSFLERRFERTQRVARHVPEDRELPTVAVVVPCFNEAKTVVTTLGSLAAMHYPEDKLQLIVVDDGSTDNTFETATTFAFRSGRSIEVFRTERGGKHAAMNHALSRTNAELIGCLDADSIAEANALLRLAVIFCDKRVAAATPGIHVSAPKTLLQHLQNVEYKMSLFNRFIFAALGSVFITPGPFSIFRTQVVRELGGWRHGHSTEDMELALRIQLHGHLIANVPKAIVHTTTPASLRGLFRQRVRWTYGWLRNALDHRAMIGNRAYGNLGLIVLPAALITLGAAIYFFALILLNTGRSFANLYERIDLGGSILPHSIELYYFNTSAVYFLVFMAIALVFMIICIGARIGGHRYPPLSTPLFLAVYGLLVPTWLCVAVVRAVFRTGVRWR